MFVEFATYEGQSEQKASRIHNREPEGSAPLVCLCTPTKSSQESRSRGVEYVQEWPCMIMRLQLAKRRCWFGQFHCGLDHSANICAKHDLASRRGYLTLLGVDL